MADEIPKVLKLLNFDDAFKPTTDDKAKGDGGLLNPPSWKQIKNYPELGRNMDKPPIENLNGFLETQRYNFVLKFFTRKKKADPSATVHVTGADFEYIRPLGAGSFGKVTMVKKKDTGIYYAKKEMAKHYIVMSKKVEEAYTEKKLLDSIRFPFTVHLKYFYQDNVCIYFVIPLVAGGELFEHLKKVGKIRERVVRFIASQVLLALEYLHFLGILHRDLKLENILIDHLGYVKIADFGMGKLIGLSRTYTICGTAEYMAPEIINHKGYGLAADWWSLGVIIYELCNGIPPFYAEDVLQIFYLISHCEYKIPAYFSSFLKNLILGLLEPDLTKRLGNLKNGINDIKMHSWFNDVPWLAVLNRQIISPILPNYLESGKFYERQKPPPEITEKVDLYAGHFKHF